MASSTESSKSGPLQALACRLMWKAQGGMVFYSQIWACTVASGFTIWLLQQRVLGPGTKHSLQGHMKVQIVHRSPLPDPQSTRGGAGSNLPQLMVVPSTPGSLSFNALGPVTSPLTSLGVSDPLPIKKGVYGSKPSCILPQSYLNKQ